MICITGGVIGAFCGDEFTEESNFVISQVVMKVKLPNSESGWIVKIKEVTDDDEQWVKHNNKNANNYKYLFSGSVSLQQVTASQLELL